MNVDAQKSRNKHENKRIIDCKKRLNIVQIQPAQPKETNKSKKLVCLFFIPRIIKYYVFLSDFNRKSLRFYV